MATRNERVILSLQDDFSSGMARAAAATAATRSELKQLDGQLVRSSKTTKSAAKDTDAIGKSVRALTPEVSSAAIGFQKFGRQMATGAAGAARLAPALAAVAVTAVPIGASLIPVITGLTAGLGAAAGAAGVTMLAFSGLGDAMESIDKARTDPTLENLAAMETELNNLGTAGRDFALYLDGLRPILNDLQNTAREGMFPGVEQGIDQLLTRLPEIDNIVSTIANTLGDLAFDAGAALAGSGFDEFFDYIQNSARPLLEDFASAIGNIGRGIGNLLAAMGPATDDFTSGLANAAAAFADWAATVDETDGFQKFIDYVRTEGPEVVDALKAMGDTAVSLTGAIAPIGSAVIDIIGPLSNLIEILSYTPAAGLAFIGRAAGWIGDLTGSASEAEAAMGQMDPAVREWAEGVLKGGEAASEAAGEVSGLNDALRELQGLLSARAAARNFEEAVDAAGQAVKDGALNFDIATERGRALVEAFDDVAESGSQAAQKAFDEGSFRKSIGFYDQTIAKLREFGRLSPGAAKAVQPLIENVRNLRRDTREAIKLKLEADTSKANSKIDETSRKASRFAGAKATVNVDADTGAANSKLDGTKKKADEVDRKKPQVKTDAVVTSTLQKLGAVDKEAADVDSSDPTVNVNAQDNASGTINGVRQLIASTDGSTATTYINVVRRAVRNIFGDGGTVEPDPVGLANGGSPGGTVPGARQPYGDKVLTHLAPGEEVITNRNGEADKWRPLLKAINAGLEDGGTVQALANGGTSGRMRIEAHPSGGGGFQRRINRINRSLDNLNGSIRNTNRAINAQEKEIERETRARQDLVSSTRSALTRDIWDTESNWNSRFTAGSVGAATQALREQRAEANEMNRILNRLQARGLDGAAFANIAEGGIDRARMFAGQSRGQLAQFERLFNQRNAAINRAASTAGDSAATVGELRSANKELRQLNRENKQREKRQDRLRDRRDKLREKRADRRSERNAKQTGREVRNSANKGRRNRR